MDIQNMVLMVTGESNQRMVLLTITDFMKKHLLSGGLSNDKIAENTEKLMQTAHDWNAWVSLPPTGGSGVKARLCMDKDMLEGFLTGTLDPDNGNSALCVHDCSPECIQLIRDYGYNPDGTYIRDMWKDAEEVLEKSSWVTTHTDGGRKFFEGEIDACFGDCFGDKTVAEICAGNDPSLDLIDRVDEIYFDARMDILDHLLYEVEEGITPLYPDGLTDNQKELMKELVEENVSYKLPYQHFLDQEVDVDITVDTGDGNYDFVLNTWAPAYGGETEGKISPKASIRWLAETQGYTEKQLREALLKEDPDDLRGFLKSIHVELANAASHMNALVFMVKMTLGELIELHKMMQKQAVDGKVPYDATQIPDCGSIFIKKTARAGLYDGWNGAGSLLEIQLEKDLELPVKFIDSADPDRAHSRWAWNIANAYAAPSSCWTSNAVSFRKPVGLLNENLAMICA